MACFQELRAFMSVALDAGGEWAVDIPAYEGLTLKLMQKGDCWLRAGHGQTVRLASGDCFLLSGSGPFTLASDLSCRKRSRAEEIYLNAKDNIAVCNGGGQFYVVGIIFRFQGHLPSLLFGRLPPVIHLGGDTNDAVALRSSLDSLSLLPLLDLRLLNLYGMLDLSPILPFGPF